MTAGEKVAMWYGDKAKAGWGCGGDQGFPGECDAVAAKEAEPSVPRAA